jgi:hypothetical protein
MKKILMLTFSYLMLTTMLSAQTEKFDIASFTAPPGWQRVDSNGVLLFQDAKTDNNQLRFCQIFLYPSRAAGSNKNKDFDDAWNSLVASVTGSKKKPKTNTEKTPDGWTAITGAGNMNVKGIDYTAMVTSVSGFGKVMNILVNVAGEEYVATVDNFFRHLEFDKNAVSNIKNSNGGSFDDYSYIVPEKWISKRENGYMHLIHEENGKYGCYITLFNPEAGSGNMENDARNYFNALYKGWQLVNVGRDILTKGYTLQSVEYCMMQGSMTRPRGEQYDYEEGAVAVLKLGNKLGVVTIRHESTGLYCQCKKEYNTWARFLNSFTMQGFTPAPPPQKISSMIVGSWMLMQSATLNNYVFAANGRYQIFNGYGDYVKIDAGTIASRSTIFKGNGKYSISGNTVTLIPDATSQPQALRVRFEQVNVSGKGWTDRIYIFNPKPVAAGMKPYESCYERSISD